MLEESMSTVPSSSIWASIFSWFTPTVFFVFVNLAIGTIFFTSTLASNKPGGPNAASGVGEGRTLQEGDEKNDPKLVRSPSVLQRLKSINLYSYRSEDPVSSTAKITDVSDDFHFSFQQQTTPEKSSRQQPPPPKEEGEEIQEPEEVEDEGTQGEERGFDENYGELKGNSEVTRTKSDVEPASGEVPIKLPKKMRKSASVKSPFSHFEEEDILETRRPATVREGKAKATEEDDEVDAKADDFINWFKQQLKLQRMDSIIRYKEMVNRGSGR